MLDAPDDAPDKRRALAALLPELRAYARFLARDRSAADDLVQDTLVRALASLGQFTAGTNLKAWVFTILRNQFFDQNRQKKREAASLLRHPYGPDDAVQPHHGDIADIAAMLFTLPPLLREALMLVGAQGMTQEEAARVCGVPAGTMRARVTRARHLLTKSFKGEPPPWEA